MTEYTTAKDWDAGVSMNVTRGPNWADIKPARYRLRFRGGDGWDLVRYYPTLMSWWNRTLGRFTGLRWWQSCPTLVEFKTALDSMFQSFRDFKDEPMTPVVPPDYPEAIEQAADDLWGPRWRDEDSGLHG